MPDNRSLRDKLRAMANQVVSPNEAKIAKKKLEEMGEPPVIEKVIASVDTRIDLWDGKIYQRISYTDGTVEDNIFYMGEFGYLSGIRSVPFDAPAVKKPYRVFYKSWEDS